MLAEDKVTEIFVMADEFCKVFDTMLRPSSRLFPKEMPCSHLADSTCKCKIRQ